MPKNFIVIGAGIGGLATALRLAHRGHRVTILEKTDQIGGRNRPLQVGQAHFDSGPTLMMMLDPFKKLFEDIGERMEDHLEIELCDPSYRVFYSDGSRLDGTPNVAQMIQQMQAMGATRDAENYPAFLGKLAGLYHDSIPHFVRKNFLNPLDFAGPKQLGIVLKRKMLSNLAKQIDKEIQDPKLRMLFSFQTMYLGLSPFDAPWVYGVLTYMEYGEGIWYPKGGIIEICNVISRLSQQKGVEIQTNSPVCKIEGSAVVLEDGRRLTADAIICNADLPYAEQALTRQPPRNHAKRRYSCSAFMIYADLDQEVPSILHHNVFFGKNFKGNLDQIFHQRALPDDPAFYVCASSKSEPHRARLGGTSLMVLVPCANLDRPWSQDDHDFLVSKIYERLEKETEFKRECIKEVKTLTPEDWKSQLNLDRGAAFGLSHDFLQSAFFRPSNKSKTNPNLYYVGASTQPGNGLPMVLISAELVEDRMRREGLI